MSKVNVNLNDINKIINALNTLKSDLNKMSDEVSKETADKGLAFLSKQYNSLYNDPNISDINTKINKTDKGYTITAYGEDVVYAEFGTGDKGQESQHPDKSKYSLNPYNSGPYIRDVATLDKDSYTMEDLSKIGITSGKFWYYEKDGIGYYTQGVPAGKQMFNTMKHLHDNVIPKIVKKRGEEINDKFIKSIKG